MTIHRDAVPVIVVLTGILATLVISVGIVLLVALPHLQRGEAILTPEGRRTVRQASRRSKRAVRGAGARVRDLADAVTPGGPTAARPASDVPADAPPAASVGRPRPRPAVSGPIPALTEPAGTPDRVIDVTDGERPVPSGTIRHAR